MWTPARRALLAGSLAVSGCASLMTPGSETGEPKSARAWADSVLMALSPRDRAAQIVWPQVFADYVANQSPGWERLTQLIGTQHVGGFVMSIGSPLETVAKINAMQRLSSVPLLFGADYEAGAGFRTRGGYFLPNGIYLGGATLFPQQMALGATRDTALARSEERRVGKECRSRWLAARLR